jgi:hypothetical protein
LHTRAAEEWSPSDEEGVEALALNGGKDRIDLAARYGVENTDLQTDGAGSFLHAPRCGLGGRIARTEEHGNTNSLGHQFMQEF